MNSNKGKKNTSSSKPNKKSISRSEEKSPIKSKSKPASKLVTKNVGKPFKFRDAKIRNAEANEASKPAPKKQNSGPKDPNEIRLNKFIANSGVCSRREADIYIESGNVKVNGEVVIELGSVIKKTDEVQFDGVFITPEKKEYVLLNKPKNFSTSGEEEMNNYRNVLELIKTGTKANFQPVGRMDKNTTGLLLFTNDTDMLRKFSIPNQKTTKIYQVSLDKNLKYEDLEKIAAGITLGEHKVYVEEISYIENEPKSEIGLKMKTPNIKVVRNIFESLNYDVMKVDRVSFAGLTKKNLPRGNWRFLTDQEVINLKNM